MKKYFLKNTITILSGLTLVFLLMLFNPGCKSHKVTSKVYLLSVTTPIKLAEVPAEPKKPDLPPGHETFLTDVILPYYLNCVRWIGTSVVLGSNRQSTLA